MTVNDLVNQTMVKVAGLSYTPDFYNTDIVKALVETKIVKLPPTIKPHK